MSQNPRELLELARSIVETITPKLLDAQTNTDLHVDSKTSANDLVTEMDRWAEQTLVAGILSARPNDAILGEEGANHSGSSGVRWVIDPIDGTTNYFYDIPGFSVSVAAQIDGETVAGLVVDPVRQETFAATLGGGATRNDEPLACSTKSELSTALVATGFNYDSAVRQRQATALATIIPRVRDIRRMGGAALDMCMVAAGRADAHYEEALALWDVAAAALICTESGASHTDIGGTADQPGVRITSAPAIHDDLVALLREARAIV